MSLTTSYELVVCKPTGGRDFVATRLSNQARDVIVRSYRLNQVTVGRTELWSVWVQKVLLAERTITSVNAVPVEVLQLQPHKLRRAQKQELKHSGLNFKTLCR